MPEQRPNAANADSLLADLNEAQREAVLATRGPVVIIAGAGTGKTRVISRRAAYAIATKSVPSEQVLLVTFTDKAATEMRERLAVLGLTNVLARTFHAQARSILRYFWAAAHGGAPLPDVAESKIPLLIPLIRNLPGGYRLTPPKDLATEIEWAKARMISPGHYAANARGHGTSLPLTLMTRLYADYERAKARAGKIDFEDMLIMAVELLEADSGARELVQSRKRWISVDEYQDTNPLQERLLRLWLGDSRDLCVVGDEDQTIYTFTGATSDYLTGFAARYEGARVIDLMANYRSSPQILALANRLIAVSGRDKHLEATAPEGPEPEILQLRDDAAEVAMIAARASELISSGLAPSQIAVLVRTNAQLPPIERALVAARVPYRVKGGLFFSRPEVREALRLLRKGPLGETGAALRRVIERLWRDEAGYDPAGSSRGEEAQARAASFATLLGIFAGLVKADPSINLENYLFELDAQTAREQSGAKEDGVNLLTYHKAKGLEWEAVFLPALEEGLLPIFQTLKRPLRLAEERRLLYVGITRARRILVLSYADARLVTSTGRRQHRQRSHFLAGLGGSSPTRTASPVIPQKVRPVAMTPSSAARAEATSAAPRGSTSDASLSPATHAVFAQTNRPLYPDFTLIGKNEQAPAPAIINDSRYQVREVAIRTLDSVIEKAARRVRGLDADHLISLGKAWTDNDESSIVQDVRQTILARMPELGIPFTYPELAHRICDQMPDSSASVRGAALDHVIAWAGGIILSPEFSAVLRKPWQLIPPEEMTSAPQYVVVDNDDQKCPHGVEWGQCHHSDCPGALEVEPERDYDWRNHQ